MEKTLDIEKVENRQINILFLRSNCQSTFAAFIANGLEYSAHLSYDQFPPIPNGSWEHIEKLSDPFEGLSNLNHNIIQTNQQLEKNLDEGKYDLVILLDFDGRLFSYHDLGKFKQIRYILGQFRKLYRMKLNSVMQQIVVMKGVAFALKSINKKTPVAVVDFDDWICLSPANQRNLRDCSYYFKRELPYNRFFLYYQNRPNPWRVWRKKLAPSLVRIKNIPLGIEDSKYFKLKDKRKTDQVIDIFFCGEPTSSLRLKALKYLKTLSQTTSWNIVIKDSLPFEEYCKVMADSKVTISISGGGWDCFRHYEAVALGSIPFMDVPLVDTKWWRNLPEEIFFANTFENFEFRLQQLLSDSLLRSKCHRALEHNIEANMLHSRIVQYIVDASLKRENIEAY